MAAFATLVALAELPEGIEKWYGWGVWVVHDPRVDAGVEAFATAAAAVAQALNSPLGTAALLVVAALLLVWSWRPVWQWRHRLRFWWRKLLAEQVWISRNDALDLIERSDWAQSRLGEKSEPLFAVPTFIRKVRDPQAMKFRHFVRMTLERFAGSNPGAVRTAEGGGEYEEGALRRYLDRAFERDVEQEFGAPPDLSV